MAKLKFKRVLPTLQWVLAGFGTLGIAGLFLGGVMMSTFLKVLPLIVHQIVGWAIIGVFILGLILQLKK